MNILVRLDLFCISVFLLGSPTNNLTLPRWMMTYTRSPLIYSRIDLQMLYINKSIPTRYNQIKKLSLSHFKMPFLLLSGMHSEPGGSIIRSKLFTFLLSSGCVQISFGANDITSCCLVEKSTTTYNYFSLSFVYT